jgi:bile acid:Na+ symporter, BASS family
MQLNNIIGILLIIIVSCLALYMHNKPKLKIFAFSVWVVVAIIASMLFPGIFGTWAGIDLAILITPLIQVIMFGMGTTLSGKDFLFTLKHPWPVLVGICLQFLVMPLTAALLAHICNFPPEIAAGIVLIGSCPGGVASNLMVYLAKGNIALSVTMTSCSTLISPIMTPLAMKLLAGQYVPIDFVSMMMSIINMIIAPVIAGLIAHKILYPKSCRMNNNSNLFKILISSLIIAIISYIIPSSCLWIFSSIKGGIIIGSILITVVSLSKITANIRNNKSNWVDKALPLVSMSGICFIIAIITARSSEQLISAGLALIGVAVILNAVGYFAGYSISKALKLPEADCRAVAFEVGMQNGGMASGLAMNVLKSASAALAPAIFGPWMNISGSFLATWWSSKDKNNNKLTN